MDALTHEFHTQSFILILWFISKFLVTQCEQLLDPKELPKLKASDASHLSFVLSLWCLCFLSLISVLSFFCIPVIKKIWQTAVEYLSNCTSVLLSDPGRPGSEEELLPKGKQYCVTPWKAYFPSHIQVYCGRLKSTEVQTVWQLTVLRVKDYCTGSSQNQKYLFRICNLNSWNNFRLPAYLLKLVF